RELPQVPPERGQPRITDVLLLMEIRPERFQVRPEHARGLEPRRIGGRARCPTVRAGRRVAPGFQHHRLDRGQFDDLARADPLLRGARQVLSATRTVRRLTKHYPVRLRPLPTRARMAERGAAFGSLT